MHKGFLGDEKGDLIIQVPFPLQQSKIHESSAPSGSLRNWTLPEIKRAIGNARAVLPYNHLDTQ
jgi:hypothetical protein